MVNKKKTLGEREKSQDIKEEVARQVKYRCIAFWSAITTITAYAGHWADGNIDPIKAGLREFLRVWLKQ